LQGSVSLDFVRTGLYPGVEKSVSGLAKLDS